MTTLEMKIDALVQMIRSGDAEIVASASKELRALLSEPVLPPVDTKDEIRSILLELGTPEHLLGHGYLVYALQLTVEDESIVHAITKELYPAVAKKFNTTPSRVERVIRHAIEATWDRGDLDTLYRYFGNTVSRDKSKPTNGEFIARIANVVRR